MNINRERFIKPKIDKYIQLYSKKARAEEATQTIKSTGVVNIENGGKFYGSDQTATISAPLSGTQPTIQLTKVNGVITNKNIDLKPSVVVLCALIFFAF